MAKHLCLLVCLITACEDRPDTKILWVPSCFTAEERTALQRWTSDCIRDANPHSDEEPEDMIAQCENTGRRIVCPEAAVVFDRHTWNTVDCRVHPRGAALGCPP